MRIALCLVCLAAFPVSALGQEPKLPPVEAPRLIVVSGVDAGRHVLNTVQLLFVSVPVSVIEKRTVDGRVVDVPVTKYVVERREITHELALREMKIFFPDGTKLTADEAVRRLKAGSSVVLANDEGVAVGRRFAEILRQDAIILVAPAATLIPDPIAAPKKPKD